MTPIEATERFMKLKEENPENFSAKAGEIAATIDFFRGIAEAVLAQLTTGSKEYVEYEKAIEMLDGLKVLAEKENATIH